MAKHILIFIVLIWAILLIPAFAEAGTNKVTGLVKCVAINKVLSNISVEANIKYKSSDIEIDKIKLITKTGNDGSFSFSNFVPYEPYSIQVKDKNFISLPIYSFARENEELKIDEPIIAFPNPKTDGISIYKSDSQSIEILPLSQQNIVTINIHEGLFSQGFWTRSAFSISLSDSLRATGNIEPNDLLILKNLKIFGMGKLHKISNKIIAGKSIQAGFYIGIKSFYEDNDYLRAKTDKFEIKNKYELEDYQLVVIPSNTITPGLYILVTEILHGQRSSEILFGETHYKSGYLVKKVGAYGSDIIDEHLFEFKPKTTLCNNEKSNLKYAIYWSFFKPAIEYDLKNIYNNIKQTIDKNEYYNNLLTIAKSYFLIDSIYNSESSLELFSNSLATVGYASNVFDVNDYMPIVISSFSTALKTIAKPSPETIAAYVATNTISSVNNLVAAWFINSKRKKYETMTGVRDILHEYFYSCCKPKYIKEKYNIADPFDSCNKDILTCLTVKYLRNMKFHANADYIFEIIHKVVGGVERIAKLSDLDSLRAEALKAAKAAYEKGVAKKIDVYYNNALSAFKSGDFRTAKNARLALRKTLDMLGYEYTLQIVSRSEARSGVWRTSSKNPTVRKYYLIVEAISLSGESLKLPIKSEENGKVRIVSEWGLGVEPQVYEQVKQDKMEDGIINSKIVGKKKRGYVTPEYKVATTGGMITEW